MLSHYFHGEPLERKSISKHEHYTQRGPIAELFGHRLWTADFLSQLAHLAVQVVRRDVTPELVAAERQWRDGRLAETLDDVAKAATAQYLVRDDTSSPLAAL